ncbi:retrotransposon gag domain-containing protein [Fagus crenata]
MTESEKRLLQRVEQMEKVIKRTYRFNEVVDLQSLSLFPKARLPPKFKMPSLDKFNGMSCPITHLKMYIRAMHPLGADNEILAQLFQNTLTGVALKWFFNLKDSRTNTWEDIYSEFFKQYRFNNEVDVTRRDLETTKQDAKEAFSSFITRWSAKAVQMSSRPSEEDQLQMVVKNLLPTYNKHLFAQYFLNFKAIVAAGTQIEDTL